jgi:hypothetical protein
MNKVSLVLFSLILETRVPNGILLVPGVQHLKKIIAQFS